MSKYGLAWLFMVMHGCIWASMVLHGCIWSCLVMCGYIRSWSCIMMYDVWLSMVLYGHVWFCIVLCPVCVGYIGKTSWGQLCQAQGMFELLWLWLSFGFANLPIMNLILALWLCSYGNFGFISLVSFGRFRFRFEGLVWFGRSGSISLISFGRFRFVGLVWFGRSDLVGLVW